MEVLALTCLGAISLILAVYSIIQIFRGLCICGYRATDGKVLRYCGALIIFSFFTVYITPRSIFGLPERVSEPKVEITEKEVLISLPDDEGFVTVDTLVTVGVIRSRDGLRDSILIVQDKHMSECPFFKYDK